VRALACVFLVHALLSGVTAWAGPCYGLDPCDHNCPDHCTRAECGPPDPCDSSCPSTYDPTADHVNDRSWLYGYDSLNRLISADFGHLNDANDAIVPDATVAEAMQSTWSLDPLGNWVVVGTPNEPGRVGQSAAAACLCHLHRRKVYPLHVEAAGKTAGR
jgi:hypothetical protein